MRPSLNDLSYLVGGTLPTRANVRREVRGSACELVSSKKLHFIDHESDHIKPNAWQPFGVGMRACIVSNSLPPSGIQQLN